MYIFLFISSILLALVSGYIGYRAYMLAGVLADQQEYTEELEFVYGMLLDKTRAAYDEMKRIDSKGSFESDDEVGTTFALLKQVTEDLREEAYGPQKEEE